jgi:hypothetical protein
MHRAVAAFARFMRHLSTVLQLVLCRSDCRGHATSCVLLENGQVHACDAATQDLSLRSLLLSCVTHASLDSGTTVVRLLTCVVICCCCGLLCYRTRPTIRGE